MTIENSYGGKIKSNVDEPMGIQGKVTSGKIDKHLYQSIIRPKTICARIFRLGKKEELCQIMLTEKSKHLLLMKIRFD